MLARLFPSIGRKIRKREYERTSLGDTIDRASMKILKEAYEASGDKNVVVSPLGVLSLLSLYASASKGDSRDEIMKLLSSTDYHVLSESYCALSEKFASMDKSYLSFANKVLVSDKYSLDEEFSKTTHSYKSEVNNIDFDDRISAANVINDWASKHTDGKINQAVDATDIDHLTVVALLNVIFFKGHWHIPFDTSETKDQDFYTANAKSVKKPMMHLLQSLNYLKDKKIGARIIELPYKEPNFRMIVVLPDKVEGLPDVVKKLSKKGLLEDVFRLSPAKVNLDMPKFEIKSTHNFNNILPKVGVSSIFHKKSRGILKEAEVKVDKVFQQAFVTVDEEGASAGAFTGLFVVTTSIRPQTPPPIPFKVDHPFLFAILHDDIILFAGTYSC